MFVFDERDFPIVKVKISGDLDSDNEFQEFLNKWTSYYDNKKDYIFVFDTREVTFPPFKYCIQMAQFIKELRKKEYQYLQESIIIINSNKVKWMLDFIFIIQPPVAPVYIYSSNNDINYSTNLNEIKNKPEITHIKPGNPLLPIF